LYIISSDRAATGASGRDDHQQLAVEGPGALEFAEQHRHSAFVVLSSL
jgi:hypothetical protein